MMICLFILSGARMPSDYRIYGVELSPYSVKVRSYFRYKQIPHQWIVRNVDTMADYQKYAKIPIIPLVVTPDEKGLQDSTPILELYVPVLAGVSWLALAALVFALVSAGF
jgi:hypothetical protein